MKKFEVPAKNNLSGLNQSIFRNLESSLGFVPNLYALLAHSENGLARHLSSNGARCSLSIPERQIINLIVSNLNNSDYCSDAYAFFARLNDLSEKQIIEVKNGKSSNKKMNGLIKFISAFITNKGDVSQAQLNAFFKAGYTSENLVDIALLSGEIIALNYIHNLAKLPADIKNIFVSESKLNMKPKTKNKSLKKNKS